MIINTVIKGAGGGGASANLSDPIRFFDYDGTLVASYEEVPSALPDIPTHEKLTNGAWTYTLAGLTTQFNQMGRCDVGANYETVSGATEIDIILGSDRSPYIRFAVNGTVTIDWGDGTATGSMTGTSITAMQSLQHSYAAAGKYTIKLTPASGTEYSMYGSNANYPILHNNGSSSFVYSSAVKNVRIGHDCSIEQYAFAFLGSLCAVSIPSGVAYIGKYAFNSCYNLTAVIMPPSVARLDGYVFQDCYALTTAVISLNITTLGSGTFSNCYALSAAIFPYGAAVTLNGTFDGCHSLLSMVVPQPSENSTGIGNTTFRNCYSLKSVSIPSGITAIYSAFYSCRSLKSITIPSNVIGIYGNAFYECTGMMEYHVKPTTPPTLFTSAFDGIPTGCTIYVPSASLNTYKTASNWSTFADRMVGE